MFSFPKPTQGEHLTEEFKAINRFQKVPCITDSQIKLAESVAIFRYLCREYQVPDHWYPADSRRQALVDEYLEWQHHNTRATCAIYFQYVWLRPRMFGTKVDPKQAEKYRGQMEGTLDFIEREYLGSGARFIAGDEITVADLLAACEIEQPSKNRAIKNFLFFFFCNFISYFLYFFPRNGWL